MPQLSPMNWTTLFMIFSLGLSAILIKSHFLSLNYIKEKMNFVYPGTIKNFFAQQM